jgi:hypothetical protein
LLRPLGERLNGTRRCAVSSFSDKLAQREIEQGAVHLGLWAQALQKARGDQAVAKTLYMRLQDRPGQGPTTSGRLCFRQGFEETLKER